MHKVEEVSENRHLIEYVKAGCRLTNDSEGFLNLWLSNNKKPCYECKEVKDCSIVVK